MLIKKLLGHPWILNSFLLFFSFLLSLGLSELIIRKTVKVRNIGPSFSIPDDEFGVVHKKNYSCIRYTPEFEMIFHTNSLGFRGNEPIQPIEKSILFLGDSFTEGYGVNDGEEFPDIIRRKTKASAHTTILNAGIGGIGTGHWIKFLNTEAIKFSPQLIIIQLCGNDFSDNLREHWFEVDRDGKLIERSFAKTKRVQRAFQSFLDLFPFLYYSHLVSALRELKFPPLQTEAEPQMQKAESLTYLMIEELAKIAKEKKWPALFLTAEIPDKREASIESLLQAYDFPLIKIPKKDTRPDLYYQVDGHWNKAGHQFVAETILANKYYQGKISHLIMR